MLSLLFCISLLLIAQVSAFSAFKTFARRQVLSMEVDWTAIYKLQPNWSTKSAAPSKAVAKNNAAPPAKKATGKKGEKDMTWGGR